jgi:UDP-N-acetylmuramoylalanine--D-glutamate ligase
MRNWQGQKVVIIGAARQGLALARFLAGCGARVILTDKRPAEELAQARQSLSDLGESIQWVCGEHPMDILDHAQLICPSGGVPLTLPLITEALRRGIPLSNDSQIFLEIAPCKVIGITGSAGKTTTTTLVGRMAKKSAAIPSTLSPFRPQNVWVGGNIGSPLLSVIDKIQPGDLAVMELSSFQLEIMTVSPQVSAVLNITPNHLDRHGDMQAYTDAKAHIVEFQSPEDITVLGRDDPGAWSLASRSGGRVISFGLSPLAPGRAGVELRDGGIYLRSLASPSSTVYCLPSAEIALRGEHNLLNVMAACAIACAAGLDVVAMRQGVQGFSGVAHRLEYVRAWGGAAWYNDSIATAPERAMAAIRSFDEPLVLLAGGRDKNLPWDEFAALVRGRVEHLVVFGEASPIILEALEKENAAAPAGAPGALRSIHTCKGLRDAVRIASQVIRPGDVVLLSPGGTSFDEFKDFEERGECFVQWVKEL